MENTKIWSDEMTKPNPLDESETETGYKFMHDYNDKTHQSMSGMIFSVENISYKRFSVGSDYQRLNPTELASKLAKGWINSPAHNESFTSNRL